jgi:hypothetical protein
MINNKNGDKKLIFHKINNYNTTTFRNNSKNDKSVKMHFNNSKPNNNHLLSKNNSTSNFMTKINKFKRKNQNNDMINQTEINLKKKDFKKKYKLDIVQTTYCGENINNIINERSHSLRTRKENSDNIRKKIKARFFKNLKNVINEKLKLAGSKLFFNLLPQKFICNISKDKNRDLSFKELFSKNFCEKDEIGNANYHKYEENKKVLEYLEKNKDIGEKSNYNILKNMKYYEIFEEYLLSKEFEMEIETLKLNEENNQYIKNYIKLSNNLIDYFYQ